MCGRFTLHHSTQQVAERFGIQQVLFPVEARYNVAPGQPIATILQNGERRLDAFKWGLVPFWAKDPSIGNRMINARAETLADKPSFKSSLSRRRCLIPADGFYEWPEKGGTKQPHHIRRRDGELFAFAGLWDEWKPKDEPSDAAPLRTCTIVTTTPNDLMATMHHRMAVILRPEDEELWLDPGVTDVPTLLDCLLPYEDDLLEAYAVSRHVNAPAFDDASCIAPLSEAEEPAPAPPAPKRRKASGGATGSLF